jgi:transcriptional regulator with XRE-family HTH domain
MASKRPITDELKAIIKGRELSPFAIASAAGVSPSTITRFLSGQRSLKVETLDALADVLGLRLTSTVGRRRSGRSSAE